MKIIAYKTRTIQLILPPFSLGRLIRMDNGVIDYTFVYEYDDAGNLLAEKIYEITAAGATPSILYVTNSYGYSTGTWGDLLTSYKGTAITYDAIGNPLSYYNGASYTFTWKGRQLATATGGGFVFRIKPPQYEVYMKYQHIQRIYENPFYVNLKKHYCPICGKLLSKTKVSGIGVIGSAISNSAIDASAYILNQAISGEEFNVADFAITATIGATTAKSGLDGSKLRGIYNHSKSALKNAISPRKIAMYSLKISNIGSNVTKEVVESISNSAMIGATKGIFERFILPGLNIR